MRHLAAEVDTAPMSLYRHVTDKRDVGRRCDLSHRTARRPQRGHRLQRPAAGGQDHLRGGHPDQPGGRDLARAASRTREIAAGAQFLITRQLHDHADLGRLLDAIGDDIPGLRGDPSAEQSRGSGVPRSRGSRPPHPETVLDALERAGVQRPMPGLTSLSWRCPVTRPAADNTQVAASAPVDGPWLAVDEQRGVPTPPATTQQTLPLALNRLLGSPEVPQKPSR
jgi:hypothetical protein